MPEAPLALPGVILAAGLSRRYGRNKLLEPLKGKPVLHWVIEALLDAPVSPIFLVVGWDKEAVIGASAPYRDSIIIKENFEYARGRAATIRKGLESLHAGAKGVLIAPGDVPLISSHLVRTLCAAFAEKQAITFPLVGGRKGHPVLFPASAFPMLSGLEGDATLHDYLLAHPGLTHPVRWEDEDCLRDVDTEEDLRRLDPTGGAGGVRRSERRGDAGEDIGAAAEAAQFRAKRL